VVVKEGVIRAAGGVVLRDGESGPEVLLVHRPAYDDWSLPKGKAEGDETDEDCALREVEEETGLRCTLGRELPSTSYGDGRGRPKVVRYWTMRPLGGEAAPRAEVDDVRWLPLDDALDALTWERDRTVLGAV
jgi:8-oxo-dGTP diphosphatase